MTLSFVLANRLTVRITRTSLLLSLAAAALFAATAGAQALFGVPQSSGTQVHDPAALKPPAGFRVALIAGENEFRGGVCQVKDLARAQQRDVPLSNDATEIVAAVKELLGIKDEG